MLQVDFLTLCIVFFSNWLTVNVLGAAGFVLLGFPFLRRFGEGLWDADYPDCRAQAFGIQVLAGGNDVG